MPIGTHSLYSSRSASTSAPAQSLQRLQLTSPACLADHDAWKVKSYLSLSASTCIVPKLGSGSLTLAQCARSFWLNTLLPLKLHPAPIVRSLATARPPHQPPSCSGTGNSTCMSSGHLPFWLRRPTCLVPGCWAALSGSAPQATRVPLPGFGPRRIGCIRGPPNLSRRRPWKLACRDIDKASEQQSAIPASITSSYRHQVQPSLISHSSSLQARQL